MMKRFAIILSLFSAAAMMPCAVYSVAPQKIERKETILRVDTIHRTDTVITTEIIRRSDVVQRTETIVRTEVPVSDSGRGAEGTVAPLYMPAHPEVVILRDTIWLPMKDSISSKPMMTREMNVEPSHSGEGSMVWIPDSVKADVFSLLNGDKLQLGTQEPEEEEEWVTFRGDTIPTMLRERNFGRFDRGLSNHLFLPKGIWTFGVTASYGEFSTSDLELLDLVSDIDFGGHIFAIRPYFSYTIRNNMGVGLRLAYTSGKARIDSFKVDIDEDMNFNLHDIEYRSESYSAALTFNQYYGLTRRGRFGITNEVELAFASGNSDFNRPYNGEPRHTHTTTMSAALNFSPGLSVFIMDPVSFNISFGVFGFSLKNEKQTVNGEKSGSRFTSSANFRFNIFNINFGIAVNI